jgi:hypothetical protein
MKPWPRRAMRSSFMNAAVSSCQFPVASFPVNQFPVVWKLVTGYW